MTPCVGMTVGQQDRFL